MTGMDRHTGRRIAGWPHARQSIIDLLTTRRGTRVQRREYGSDALDLIDRPASGATVLDRFVAIATAIDRWEPRVDLTGFRLIEATPGGQATIGVDLREMATGLPQSVEVTL